MNEEELNKVLGTARLETQIPVPVTKINTIPRKENILEEATKIIYGDREQTYGDPSANLKTIAEYWTIHLRRKYSMQTPLTVDDVCGMMILLKQARLANDPTHRDSLVDIAGYAALQERCAVVVKSPT